MKNAITLVWKLRKNLLLTFLLVIGILGTNKLAAETKPFNVNEIPFSLEGNWQVCVQANLDSQLECKAHAAGAVIEESFAEFDGFIIYHSQFSISKSLSQQTLGIYISQVRDSDQVYLNGQLIASTGSFPPDFQKATLYSRYYYIPSHLLKSKGLNQLDIKIFNHTRFGGIVNQAPVIDSAEAITHRSISHDSLLSLYAGIFILISIIQFFYYFAQPDHKEHLYFALLCIAEALYLWTYSSFALHSGLDLNLIFRFNVFLFAVLTFVFCFFITEFFRFRRNRLVKIALALVAVSGLIQLFFLPLDYMYHQVVLLDLMGVFVFIPLYFYLFYRSIKEGLPYARIMSFVIILHLIMVLIDIAVDLKILPVFFSGIAGMISPISLLLVFIIIALILMHKHWLYYRHATYDYLTDALRRSAFVERLTEEIPRSQRLNQSLMVALLDIDNFKEINDQHTHIAGDQVLRELVRRTKQELREFDLLGRYGGDEFCFAAMVADTRDATSLLKRIQQQISQKAITLKDGKNIDVSITLGAYVAEPTEPLNAEQLLHQADKILVQGKVNQKGRIHI